MVHLGISIAITNKICYTTTSRKRRNYMYSIHIHKLFKEFMERDLDKSHTQPIDKDIQYATAIVYWVGNYYDLRYGFYYSKYDHLIAGLEILNQIKEERENSNSLAKLVYSEAVGDSIRKCVEIMKEACGNNDRGETILACVKYDYYKRYLRKSFSKDSKQEFDRIWGSSVSNETYDLGKKTLKKFETIYTKEYYKSLNKETNESIKNVNNNDELSM